MTIRVVPLELRLHPKERGIFYKKDLSESILPLVYYTRDPYMYLYLGNRYLSITYYLYHFDGLKYIKKIRIIFDYQFGLPKYVYFSSHEQEGIWVKWADCEFNNNRLVIYSSMCNKALRPHPGTTIRIFGLKNNKYSNNGKHIIPVLIEDLSIQYTKIQNEEVFTSLMRRFFKPCLINKIDNYKEKQKNYEIEINKHVNHSDY